MRGNPIIQTRVPRLVADQLRQHAKSLGKTPADVLREAIEDVLKRSGFRSPRTKSGAPRIEKRLRELAHREPSVVGADHRGILKALSESYASPQAYRRRARLAWCVEQQFILPAGRDYYRLNTGEIHRRLCQPDSCAWLAQDAARLTSPPPTVQSSLPMNGTGGESYGSTSSRTE